MGLTGIDFLQHLGLVVAALALYDAGLQLASTAEPRGPARAIAACVVAATLACATAIALGTVGLSGEPVALLLAALLAMAASRGFLPARAHPLLRELLAALSSLRPLERALLGAVAGLALAGCAWMLLTPHLSQDATTYHLPISILWVQAGNAPAINQVFAELPVGNYPVTGELLTSWGIGISGGLGVAMLYAPAALALLAGSFWSTLRTLGAGRLATGLGVVAVASSPILLRQLEGPGTDLPAAAWLVATAALCAAATAGGGNPRLLPFALAAAGLAVGTKTTVAPLLLLVLVATVVRLRGQLAPHRDQLLVGLGAGVLVGGLWYLRNLILHGSPLWPFISGPFGDPRPELIELVDPSLIDRPETLEGRGAVYLERLGGMTLLFCGGLLAPLLSRQRSTLLAAAGVALGLLAWANAPVTGLPNAPELSALPLSALRYLVPVAAAGAATIVLASRAGPTPTAISVVVLSTAIGLNAWGITELVSVGLPPLDLLGAGAIAGSAVAVGLFAERLRLPRAAGPRVAVAVAGVAAATAVALSSARFVERHIGTPGPYAEVVRALEDEPRFGEGAPPVGFDLQMVAPLAGNRLERSLELIPADESCAAVRARLGRGWLVIGRGEDTLPVFERVPIDDCLAGLDAEIETRGARIYAPRAG